mmetsp:Transcript_12196/g.28439  ORF Transcript_12196/g.28439 Transcript_12196/m.28439 type:complete len:287 (+) Transcript_12196:765-1625(+)
MFFSCTSLRWAALASATAACTAASCAAFASASASALACATTAAVASAVALATAAASGDCGPKSAVGSSSLPASVRRRFAGCVFDSLPASPSSSPGAARAFPDAEEETRAAEEAEDEAAAEEGGAAAEEEDGSSSDTISSGWVTASAAVPERSTSVGWRRYRSSFRSWRVASPSNTRLWLMAIGAGWFNTSGRSSTRTIWSSCCFVVSAVTVCAPFARQVILACLRLRYCRWLLSTPQSLSPMYVVSGSLLLLLCVSATERWRQSTVVPRRRRMEECSSSADDRTNG